MRCWAVYSTARVVVKEWEYGMTGEEAVCRNDRGILEDSLKDY